MRALSEKFDAIVVGGGPAGLTASYFLAKSGLDTVVFERGPEPGSKNVFGGRIYSYVLDKYFPGWRREAPIERWVRRERISVLCGDDSKISLEYLSSPPQGGFDSFTAFLSRFLSWLAGKAEEAGATIITNARVDEILFDSKGYATGVVVEGEKIEADYILIAEGANTLLLEKHGLRFAFQTITLDGMEEKK